MFLLKLRSALKILMALSVPLCATGFSQAQVITVKGHVTVVGSGSRDRAAANANAVVWLTPIGQSADPADLSRPPATYYQLVQQGKRFRPHILVVPVGAVVEFPNHDPFFHNVFSLFDGKRFDLGLYEAGSTKTVNFNSPGVSYIFCNIHPEMSAVVIVTQNPYYAHSSREGEVVIKHVLPGRYELNVWHERCLPDTLKALSREVVISPSSSSLGEIPLTETGDLLAKHKNKYGRDYDAVAPADSTYAQP